MSHKKRVLENSFLYIFSALLVKAIAFFLLPIYTLFLTPEDYGITNLVSSFINVVTFIVAFSLYSAAIRLYADYKQDKAKLKSFFGTIITFIFISGIIFFGIGLIFKTEIVSLFFQGLSFYPIVFIALSTLPFVSLHTMHQSILQGMQQGKKLTAINLIVFGITVLLNLFFIIVLKFGALGFIIAQFIVNVGYFIFMIIDLRKQDLFAFCMDFRILREALKYSIPLMPHDLSTRIASLASRVFINRTFTFAIVGLYSISMQFGTLIDTVQVAVNRAFQPWFYEMMNDKNPKSKKEAVSLSNVLLIFYSLIYMGIGLFSQEVVIIMTDKRYLMSWTIIPILVIGFSIKSIYYFYVNVIMFYKQAARKLFIATIVGSFTDVLLAYLLVPSYGMYGAAFAFIFAKIIMVSIVVFISNQYDDVGYRVTKMISIIVPSLLFMGAGLYFSYTKYMIVFSWGNLIYKLFVLLCYVSFLYLTNRKVIKQIFNSGQIQQMLRRKKDKK